MIYTKIALIFVFYFNFLTIVQILSLFTPYLSYEMAHGKTEALLNNTPWSNAN